MAKRRLAILRHAEEITGNVALTCRYYGISRQVFYKWRVECVNAFMQLVGLMDEAPQEVAPVHSGSPIVSDVGQPGGWTRRFRP
jgi:hypothetical protein